jgi:hypothetical protein
MRQNSPTCICNFKNFSKGLYPWTLIIKRRGRGQETESGEEGKGRRGRGEGRERRGEGRERGKGEEVWELLPPYLFRKVGAYGYYRQQRLKVMFTQNCRILENQSRYSQLWRRRYRFADFYYYLISNTADLALRRLALASAGGV